MTAWLTWKSMNLWQAQSAQLSLAALCSPARKQSEVQGQSRILGISKGTAELASHGKQDRQERNEVREKLTECRRKSRVRVVMKVKIEVSMHNKLKWLHMKEIMTRDKIHIIGDCEDRWWDPRMGFGITGVQGGEELGSHWHYKWQVKFMKKNKMHHGAYCTIALKPKEGWREVGTKRSDCWISHQNWQWRTKDVDPFLCPLC